MSKMLKALAALVMLIPGYLLVVNAVKDQDDILHSPFGIPFGRLTLEPLRAALANPDYSLLRVYEIVLALTGGGPAGRTNTFAFLILSESFRSNHLGYGAAQAITLMVVIAGLALGLTALRRRAEEAVSA